MKPGAFHYAIGLMMIASAAAAGLLKPTHRLAEQGPRVELSEMIPRAFHDWHVEPGRTALLVSPNITHKMNQLYNQTLARTYVNNRGDAIMLSIVYGGNQADQSMQVHRPEFCYRSQGFHILENASGKLRTPWGDLPVRRLAATRGARHEPITYWITVGDHATLPGFGRKLLQLKYGLTGRIPDGMLIRVSSIDPNDARAYRRQREFIASMLTAIAQSGSSLARKRLARLGIL